MASTEICYFDSALLISPVSAISEESSVRPFSLMTDDSAVGFSSVLVSAPHGQVWKYADDGDASEEELLLSDSLVEVVDDRV